MKKILATLISFLICFLWIGTASATLIGSYSGNDNNDDQIQEDIMHWFADSEYTADENWDWETFAFYDKSEFNEGASDPFTEYLDSPSENGLMEITGTLNDEGELKSGSFETNDPINFYSLKAGPSYDLYWSDPASSSIDWGPTDKGMSHISAWTVEGGAAPVPEPETMVLLGLGCLGLLSFGWRKKLFIKQKDNV